MANEKQDRTLYLVATPIGNLSDLSDRAAMILKEVDFIAAEDTRVTAKLLSAFGIASRVIPYHEHNKRTSGPKIIDRLANGESCALVTDAGTPAISDPGQELASLARQNGIDVVPIPGCCAAICALSGSGMPSRRFVFEGFLPSDKKERLAVLESLAAETRTIVLYEAPHRLTETLAVLYDSLGDRKVVLCRELTKQNEEWIDTTLSGALETYTQKEPRGEYVLVIAGASTDAGEPFWAPLTISEHVSFYEKQGMTRMDAMKRTAKDRAVAKNEIYKAMLTEDAP